jgi:molecular chaperone IbpA
LHKYEGYPKPAQPSPAEVITRLVNGLTSRGVGFTQHSLFFEELQNQIGARATYPPYDILSVGKDEYEIRLAVAGFTKEELDITFKEQVLTIEGRKLQENDDAYFHKGIAARAFKQNFPLAEYVEVEGAEIKDGILTIRLKREVPEELKPKTIKIK